MSWFRKWILGERINSVDLTRIHRQLGLSDDYEVDGSNEYVQDVYRRLIEGTMEGTLDERGKQELFNELHGHDYVARQKRGRGR